MTELIANSNRTKARRSRSPTQLGRIATVVLLARDAMKSRDRENHNDYTPQVAGVCRAAVSKHKWLTCVGAVDACKRTAVICFGVAHRREQGAKVRRQRWGDAGSSEV